MVMFSCFMDESGTQKQDQILTVGGVLSTDAAWIKFSRKWRAALGDIPDFHLLDFKRRRGRFKGWDDSRCRSFERKARAIIWESVKYPVATGVRKGDWQKIGRHFRDPDMQSPYTFCALYSMVTVAKWVKAHVPTGLVSYHFEAGHQGEEELDRLLRWIFNNESTRNRFLMHQWSFVDRQSWPPGQAADILAAESKRLFEDERLTGDNRHSPWIDAFCRSGEERIAYFSEDQLRAMLPRLRRAVSLRRLPAEQQPS